MLIHTGAPKQHGIYVAYINGPVPNVADRVMLFWDGDWSYPSSTQRYRDHVYGWVGPLPVMKLDDAEPAN
jgi:hypothetical protein